ncbi:MAG: hypothetical protein AVDCRST_MAG54-1522, partial [uncultured Actinomycetospora sp.]
RSPSAAAPTRPRTGAPPTTRPARHSR